MKKIWSRVLCLILSIAMVASLTACGDTNGAKKDAFVIMTEQLDGLFNPFFYTAAADGTIVSMTQIGMLGSKFENGKVQVAYGDNEAVVTKDYDITENADGTVTYRFVLKNGIKFSDGHPLTMEDVLFNYYVYLDPVYTGSNTLYSTDILGLKEYRTQTVTSGGSDDDDKIGSLASARAVARMNELINLFNAQVKASSTKEVSYEAMKSAIIAHSVSNGYKQALAVPSEMKNINSQNLLNDYEYALKLFKEELETDYVSAQESYVDAPYDKHEQFKDEVFCFMYT